MRKICTRVLVIAVILLVIDWGVVGLKLLDGEYDITAGAYIAAACLVIILVCGLCRALTDKCPHCGRLRLSHGKYCPHCGREL